MIPAGYTACLGPGNGKALRCYCFSCSNSVFVQRLHDQHRVVCVTNMAKAPLMNGNERLKRSKSEQGAPASCYVPTQLSRGKPSAFHMFQGYEFMTPVRTGGMHWQTQLCACVRISRPGSLPAVQSRATEEHQQGAAPADTPSVWPSSMILLSTMHFKWWGLG